MSGRALTSAGYPPEVVAKPHIDVENLEGRDPFETDRLLDMIRFSVYYPKSEGSTFDHDYYRDKHVPLAVKTWGTSGAEIDKGLDGPYVAAVHFKFASQDDLSKAMALPGTGEVLADVANYTNIQPVVQTSEVVG